MFFFTFFSDAELFSKNQKKAVQNTIQNEDFFISSLLQNLKLEDIFTNLIMYHGSKEQSKSSHKDLLTCKTEIQNIQDIFVGKAKKECFKSIIMEGNPGQGKTVFCRKLLQEWSQDQIFNQDESAHNPDFKFAFLIPFRQLNMLIEKKMNFGELLNYFSMLDEKINDSVIEYIIQHPEQLLIIMDGFDEYEGQERQKIFHQYFAVAQIRSPISSFSFNLENKK